MSGSKRNSVRIIYILITVSYGCNNNPIDYLFMGRKLGRNSRATERVTCAVSCARRPRTIRMCSVDVRRGRPIQVTLLGRYARAWREHYSAGPVVDQPSRRRTPPGVGTPLQAAGPPDQRHPQEKLTRPRGEGINERAWKEHHISLAAANPRKRCHFPYPSVDTAVNES